MDISQLIHKTAAEALTIRGVNFPEGKRPNACNVTRLNDYICARGGKTSGMLKDAKVKLV